VEGWPWRRLAGLILLLPSTAVKERAVFARALGSGIFPG